MPGQPAANQTAGTPAQGDDPYAAWGGYQNFLAMWYAAAAKQAATGQPTEQPKPPGTS